MKALYGNASSSEAAGSHHDTVVSRIKQRVLNISFPSHLPSVFCVHVQTCQRVSGPKSPGVDATAKPETVGSKLSQDAIDTNNKNSVDVPTIYF